MARARKGPRRSAKVSGQVHRSIKIKGIHSSHTDFFHPKHANVFRGLNKDIHKSRAPKMKGAHPLHDPTGKIHAPTGARLADGHAKVFSPFKPYKIPKGMVPQKRVN